MGAGAAAVADDSLDGPAAKGPAAGLRRDLVACANRLTMAGCAPAVRALADGVHDVPALADRWHVGRGLEEPPSQSRWGRRHPVGGSGRLRHLPGPSARCWARERGAVEPGWARPDGLATEPYDHAIGRSRGGLTTRLHLAVNALLPRPGHRDHRRTASRCPVVRQGHGTHPCSRGGRRTPARPPGPCPCRPCGDQAGHRLRRGSAGGRPPGFDREMCKRRHRVQCRIGLLEQARAVAARYDKLAVRHEATVQLTLVRQAL
jgi:hypothetical protein